MLPFPVLLGDIGGTYARFVLLPGPDQPMIPLAKGLTAAHPDPTSAIRSALQAHGGSRPRSALLAVAARVDAPVVRLTNAAWAFDAKRIGVDLALDPVLLVNDFAPVAASLSRPDHFGHDGLVRIGAAAPPELGPLLALGPGTGLGAAALLPVGERFLIQPTEAGHSGFGPCESDEFALWPLLERPRGLITAETVLSGPGLVRLYRALAATRKAPGSLDTPPEIVAAHQTGTDAAASDALVLFGRLLGRFAGDLALIFGATGGVFIAGGIAPRITGLLQGGAFRAAFERKPPFEDLMRRIPTFVITHPDPALTGLGMMASTPERFLIVGQAASRTGASIGRRDQGGD
jgi:glucokinase